jgi:hypothetical protein
MVASLKNYITYFLSFSVLGNFFSFHESGQRKEAKERHLIPAKISWQKDTPFRWSGQSVCPKGGNHFDKMSPAHYPIPHFSKQVTI